MKNEKKKKIYSDIKYSNRTQQTADPLNHSCKFQGWKNYNNF